MLAIDAKYILARLMASRRQGIVAGFRIAQSGDMGEQNRGNTGSGGQGIHIENAEFAEWSHHFSQQPVCPQCGSYSSQPRTIWPNRKERRFPLRKNREDTKAKRQKEVAMSSGRMALHGKVEVMAWFGDAAHDFPNDVKLKWGRQKFMLPNPAYGSW